MSKNIPMILIYTIAWATLIIGADNVGPSDNSTVVAVFGIIATVVMVIAQAIAQDGREAREAEVAKKTYY